MKRKLWTLLLALGAALALCVGASATEVSTADALTGDSVELNGEYKLIADITIDRSIVINKEKSVTLDLNGHVLNLTDTSGGDSWITVEGGGNLTITDSNPTVPHNFEPNADGLWVLNENGTKSVTGGVITGGTGYQYQKVQPNGTVYIVKAGGKLTMEGGNIVGCSAVYGGGVYLDSSANSNAGTFTMNDGRIIGCTAGMGGGVYMRDDDTVFNMSGSAAIRYCKAASKDSSHASGGGVYALGAFTMSGNAAIRDCECITDSRRAAGGGVFVSYHNKAIEFTMSGSAVIENCKVTASSPNSWTTSYGGGVYVAEGSSLVLEDNTKIKDCSAENTSGGATYGGGIFVSGNLTIAGSAEVGENCTAGIGSGIYLEVRSYSSDSKNLYANGGVIAGEVVLNNVSNYGGTITITGSDEGVTEFKGSVLNNGGTIEKGNFTGKVTNNGTISGGEFSGEVTNNKTISGGTFSETVINGEGGTIAEGVSITELKFIVTFDNEGTRTTAIIDNGGKLNEPTVQTKEGYRFGGWYYDNSGGEAKWDFDTDTVTRAMTLTAKWVQTYTVTFETSGGSAVDPVTVDAGSTVSKPADPARSGYAFDGWYTENTYENPYDFHAAVTGSLTLYAKWNAIVYSDPTYAVSAPTAENGKIAVSPRYAERGERVTVTLTPDEGYELESLTVTDSRGNELTLTDKGDGRYTFTMPARRVEIKASFVKSVEVSPFADVAIDAYYYEAVKWAVKNGITDGVGNGLFGPNQPCTRGQIVTFLWRAAGSPVVNYWMPFTDVDEGAYYAEAARWAASEGITTGAGESSFSPDATCTRAQAVTFLARALNANASGKAEFGDVPTDSYFAEAVAWAAANGVTEGVGGGLFGSDNSCTRGQIVTFLYRAYNK